VLIDLTFSETANGVRIDAPGLSFRDLVPILRGQFPDGWLVIHHLEDFRGAWPPRGAVERDGRIEIGVEAFMDEVESLLLEGGGPLFHQIAFSLFPDAPGELPDGRGGASGLAAGAGGLAVGAFIDPPPGVPGPRLPGIPAGGLTFASEDDFLAAVGVPDDEAPAVFAILFRAVFVDHPGVSRGLFRDDAERLYQMARTSGGIHFNPEKWRADPEGRVSLANLGCDFHFPCHNAPTEGKLRAIRLTDTGERLLVSEPFAIEVNDYLDRWYDRPVGCKRFVQAGLIGGAVILVLLIVLFLTRR
jgi:hypothetical protein